MQSVLLIITDAWLYFLVAGIAGALAILIGLGVRRSSRREGLAVFLIRFGWVLVGIYSLWWLLISLYTSPEVRNIGEQWDLQSEKLDVADSVSDWCALNEYTNCSIKDIDVILRSDDIAIADVDLQAQSAAQTVGFYMRLNKSLGGEWGVTDINDYFVTQ